VVRVVSFTRTAVVTGAAATEAAAAEAAAAGAAAAGAEEGDDGEVAEVEEEDEEQDVDAGTPETAKVLVLPFVDLFYKRPFEKRRWVAERIVNSAANGTASLAPAPFRATTEAESASAASSPSSPTATPEIELNVRARVTAVTAAVGAAVGAALEVGAAAAATAAGLADEALQGMAGRVVLRWAEVLPGSSEGFAGHACVTIARPAKLPRSDALLATRGSFGDAFVFDTASHSDSLRPDALSRALPTPLRVRMLPWQET
jgi:hypothetical protein